MRKPKLTTSHALVALGLLFVLPGLFTSGMFGASAEDWAVASTPIARLPLDSLGRSGSVSLVFVVPTSEQWIRIRETWGDPGYVVFGTSQGPSPSVVGWSTLGVEAEASTRLGALRIEPAGAFHRSGGSQDTGVVFRPRPGERVRLDLKLANSELPVEGELVVAVNWDADTKGRMLNMVFNIDFRRYLRWGLIVGVFILVAAALMPNQKAA
jgi:hypothetical protein